MAYLVVSFKGKELGRWPIKQSLSIGRAGECDIIVRDILLSRRHCQIEAEGKGWVAVDLGSKNGTRLGRHRITRQPLRDGDTLTLGKTTLRFQIGKLPGEYIPPAKRPADPFEAMSGTVSDFDPVAAEAFCRDKGLPQPRPVPREPDAYAKDDLYGLLTDIASSSWDSIYAQASQPKRPTRVESMRRPAAGGTPTLEAPRQRSRAFAEELQVKELGTTRPVRPADPLELLPAASSMTPHTRTCVPASTTHTRREPFARMISAICRPLVALHGWVVPEGKIRLF